MLYDSLLVAAVLMVTTAAFLPFTRGEAITFERFGPLEYLYRAVLLLVIVAFFGWFWTARGQTLGMRAWRLRLEREDHAPLRWSDALKRLAGATVSLLAFGLGYFWIWVDRDRLAWHDRWSHTRVVVVPKVTSSATHPAA
jgi:uncharacterized RDD family membrane protein YckC